jgi:hypothetical protein
VAEQGCDGCHTPGVINEQMQVVKGTLKPRRTPRSTKEIQTLIFFEEYFLRRKVCAGEQ